MEYKDKFNLSIIPVNIKNKKPLIKWTPFQHKKAGPEIFKKWLEQYPDAGWGIVTGNISNLFIIDCDSLDGYKAIMALVPSTLKIPTVKTPRGHHLYFKYPTTGNYTTGAGILPGVDFRGQGGYVVAPPTVNSKGGIYKWLDRLSLNEITPPETPPAILELIPTKNTKKKPVKHADFKGFAMVKNEVIKSDAYKSLTNSARTAYTLLLAQIKKKGQSEVKYPYSAAADYMQQRTFTKAINQLIEIGFIIKKQSGGLYRRTNIYQFSDTWRDYSSDPDTIQQRERDKRG